MPPLRLVWNEQGGWGEPRVNTCRILFLWKETDSQKACLRSHTCQEAESGFEPIAQSPGPSTEDKSRLFSLAFFSECRDYHPAGRAHSGVCPGSSSPFLRMLVSCLLKLSSPARCKPRAGRLMPDGVLGTDVSEQEALGLHRFQVQTPLLVLTVPITCTAGKILRSLHSTWLLIDAY